ncbi:hypothetical protein EVAR_23870_1 [Eumeta japonica]|uniref:Uncharacterized protein n=1 Tax=Eumeta variegata TaxID=151549 RepID=A0A4C1V5C4_EUMVA|nr:hypothetical protein EVAR_23870_1 [Eumeta japonica]
MFPGDCGGGRCVCLYNIRPGQALHSRGLCYRRASLESHGKGRITFAEIILRKRFLRENVLSAAAYEYIFIATCPSPPIQESVVHPLSVQIVTDASVAAAAADDSEARSTFPGCVAYPWRACRYRPLLLISKIVMLPREFPARPLQPPLLTNPKLVALSQPARPTNIMLLAATVSVPLVVLLCLRVMFCIV